MFNKTNSVYSSLGLNCNPTNITTSTDVHAIQTDLLYFFHHLWILAVIAINQSMLPLTRRQRHPFLDYFLSLQSPNRFIVWLTIPQLWVTERISCLPMSAKSFSWNFLSFWYYCYYRLWLCYLVSIVHDCYFGWWQALQTVLVEALYLQSDSMAFT